MNIEQVKSAARGRWPAILAAAGVPEVCMSGKNVPCPKCGGKDRFAAFRDVAETGGVNCRKCHSKGNGDGVATVQWWRDCTFQEALAFVAEQVGLDGVKSKANGKPRIVATYDYKDENGKLLFQVVRYEPKNFRQRKPDGKGGWSWNVKGVRQVPYRLPDILEAPGKPVVIVEGEKDADRLASLGILATCNAGGARKWTKEHAKHLKGRKAAITPDADPDGQDHAHKAAETLNGIAKSARIVELPGLQPKGDVSDWLNAGGTKEQLVELIKATPLWRPGAQPWPKIEPFNATVLPEFPIDALPGALREWVKAESHATQTPPELAAFLALAVGAAAIARHVEVEPRPGWEEPTNLFVSVLLKPGNRKTTVFKNAMAPLKEVENELIEGCRASQAIESTERRQAEKRLTSLEKKLAEKPSESARAEASQLAAKLSEWPEPVKPALITDDATSEKVGIILADQGGRIASMSAEGGVFDLMAGLYSKSGMPHFTVYLMGHSGDDVRVDRVGRKSLRIERPALTCAYAMQPAVIEGLAEHAAFRGRGLLARFLYAAPKSWVGERKIAAAPVPESVYSNYRQLVRQLAESPPKSLLKLGDLAHQILIAWEEQIEEMLDEGGDMEVMTDWGAKLAGATLRLAASLHCFKHALNSEIPQEIDEETIVAAIEIANYAIPHAEAVFRMMQADRDKTEEDALYILRWIKRHEKKSFTKRDMHQHGRQRFKEPDAADKALALLKSHGYVRPKATERSGPGRPPSPAFEVNPAVFELESRKKRSQNTQKTERIVQAANSENTEDAFQEVEKQGRVQVTL